jgi:hypothetical protein
MKTIKISDQTHAKLTRLVGKLTAKTGKKQTYDDATRALLQNSVLIPENLLLRAEKLIQENKDLGYASLQDFIEEAMRIRIEEHTGE